LSESGFIVVSPIRGEEVERASIEGIVRRAGDFSSAPVGGRIPFAPPDRSPGAAPGRLNMKPLFVLALSTLALFSGCASDFQFEEIEVQVRCAGPDAAAGVLLVERGIYGGSSEFAATDALRSILQGRRQLPPEGGFLSMDFDAEQKKSESEGLSQVDDEERKLLDLARGFRVEKAGLFEDEKGRLCLYQFWTFEDPKRLLAWLDEKTNKDVIERTESNKPRSSDFPYLDEASRSRALARARANGSWLRIENGGLVIDLPISRECAAKCATDLIQKEDVRSDFGPFVTLATSLEISEERTLLEYRPGSSGWLGPWISDFKNQGNGRLHAWIKSGALPIGSPPDLAKLDEILRLRESLKSSSKQR
jgi:hypothetical protein